MNDEQQISNNASPKWMLSFSISKKVMWLLSWDISVKNIAAVDLLHCLLAILNQRLFVGVSDPNVEVTRQTFRDWWSSRSSKMPRAAWRCAIWLQGENKWSNLEKWGAKRKASVSPSVVQRHALDQTFEGKTFWCVRKIFDTGSKMLPSYVKDRSWNVCLFRYVRTKSTKNARPKTVALSWMFRNILLVLFFYLIQSM